MTIRCGRRRLFPSPCLIFGAALLLSGCMLSEVQLLGKIDASDKVTAVPPGSGLLIGPIKQRLTAAGWKLVVSPGDAVTKYASAS